MVVAPLSPHLRVEVLSETAGVHQQLVNVVQPIAAQSVGIYDGLMNYYLTM